MIVVENWASRFSLVEGPGHREIRGSDVIVNQLYRFRKPALQRLNNQEYTLRSEGYRLKGKKCVCPHTVSEKRRMLTLLFGSSRAHLGLLSGINYRIQQRLN